MLIIAISIKTLSFLGVAFLVPVCDNHNGCFLVLQEVMEDPYIAADGFTYEEEAIRGWLNSGHDTSPMTNLKLDHTDLVPNYALHNAILEWQQQ